jgi:transcription elongation factor Elf1
MVIKQSVQCPHCGNQYSSQIEFTADQTEAQEQCEGCRRTIYFRIKTDSRGNLGGIEIHLKKN